MADEITLTLPRDPEFGQVAHLVLGGLAVRLNLTYENLEDMKIALDALLGNEEDEERGDVTVRMTPRDGVLETVVGPVRRDLLEQIGGDASELGLRRVLESTVDEIDVDGDTVRLTKRVSGG
jgi:anti-sigma regulatory factor (Ser/Thr protein kinase)